MIYGSERVFSQGVIASGGVIGAVLSDLALERGGEPNSILGLNTSGAWEAVDIRPWPAASLTRLNRIQPEFFALATHGVVCRFGSFGAVDEVIVPVRDRAPLLGLGTVAETVFAVGLDRQVFQRLGPDRWIEMPVPTFPSHGELAGFNTVAGFALDDMYVAGWDGEIWHYDGQLWHYQATPTNLILTSIVCAFDGIVYACGRHGTVLRGGAGRWEMVDVDSIEDDFFSIVEWQGTIYVASMQGIYQIDGATVIAVEIDGLAEEEDELSLTFGHLSVADTLCSVGEIDVLLRDGPVWRRIGTE